MAHATKIEGTVGVTIRCDSKGETFRAGSLQEIDQNALDSECIPFRDPGTTFWLCGTFSAWDRSRPKFEAWALSTWIEAPNQRTAIERLRTYIELESDQSYDDIHISDFRLPMAVEQTKVRLCSANYAAERVIAWDAPAERTEEVSYYLCVQRLRAGFNACRTSVRTDETDRLLSILEEEIVVGSSPPTKSFEDLPEKIQQRIVINKRHGCWIWDPKRQWDGRLSSLEDNYGRTSFEGRSWAVHRLIYTLLGGVIHPEAVLRHQCHRKRCCNPEHIIPGSNRQNYFDSPRKVRRGKKRHLGVLRAQQFKSGR